MDQFQSVDVHKFKPSHNAKRLKIGEMWRTTGQIAYCQNPEDGYLDLKNTSLKKRKVADVYVDLSLSEWMSLEAIKHPAGVVGLSVIAVPVIVPDGEVRGL